MNLSKLLVTVTAFAGIGVAQSPTGVTTVTFSEGPSCAVVGQAKVNGPPAFNALSLMTQIGSGSTQGTAAGRDARGGAGAAQLVFGDIALTKSIDACSISLYTLLFKGQPVRKVVISLFTDMTTEVMQITLANVFIDSISDSETSPSLPVERIALNFDAISLLDPITNTKTCWNRLTASASCTGL